MANRGPAVEFLKVDSLAYISIVPAFSARSTNMATLKSLSVFTRSALEFVLLNDPRSCRG